MVSKYDAIILGGGKAGKTLAMDLAKSGQHVAMVEDNQIGGTCINVACIPTKTLVKSAKIAHYCRTAQAYGLQANLEPVDFKALRARKQAVVKAMRDANLKQFLDSGMDLLLGRGRFVDYKTIEVTFGQPHEGKKTEQITADRIFINTGALPFIPPISGLSQVHYHTNDTLMNIDYLPAHLIIIGGGYIGLEFAQIFRRFGSQVTVIEAAPVFLAREDRDVAEQVQTMLQHEGVQFLIDAKINQVIKEGKQVVFDVYHAGQSVNVSGSDILVAVGRIPNTAGLDLDRTGVAVDERGFVKVNDYLETAVEGIWVLGDVKGGAQFTHLSWDDYRLVKYNLTHPGNKRGAHGRLIPYSVFLDPELARLGMTETEARQSGRAIKVAKIQAAMIPRAKTQGETTGMLKAVIDADTDEILGVSILCAEAGEMLGVIQVAMEMKLPYHALRDMMFAHPTMVEGINIWFGHVH